LTSEAPAQRSTRSSLAVRSAATNWWCCSTPEARRSISKS
jgi:hypothetical protein